jgi:SMC interacting uncharacterized protein involved in chromosome segregation
MKKTCTANNKTDCKPPNPKQLHHELTKLNLQKNAAKKKIGHIIAKKNVKKSEVPIECNDYRIKAMEAMIAEYLAQIDVEKVNIQIMEFQITNLQMQLDAALMMEPEVTLPYMRMAQPIAKTAPPQFLPPAPFR